MFSHGLKFVSYENFKVLYLCVFYGLVDQIGSGQLVKSTRADHKIYFEKGF